jgi:hypothetical protein
VRRFGGLMRGGDGEQQAKRQALARRINEHIDDAAERGRVDSEVMLLAWECPRSCDIELEVSHADYEKARADPLLFLVAHGHEASGVDEVVTHAARYVVVRKAPGRPTEVAVTSDPRS